MRDCIITSRKAYKMPYFGRFLTKFKEFSMKNLFKLFGIIAFVAIIGFSMIACDILQDDQKDDTKDGQKDELDSNNNQQNGQGTGTPDGTFNSIADMAAWLDGKSVNTTSTPYYIKLNVSDLGGGSTTSGSTGYVLMRAYDNKDYHLFVSLDLSDDTITSIGQNAFYRCTSLTSVTFQGTIASGSFSNANSFPGNLREKFYQTNSANETPGTYTNRAGEQ